MMRTAATSSIGGAREGREQEGMHTEEESHHHGAAAVVPALPADRLPHRTDKPRRPQMRHSSLRHPVGPQADAEEKHCTRQVPLRSLLPGKTARGLGSDNARSPQRRGQRGVAPEQEDGHHPDGEDEEENHVDLEPAQIGTGDGDFGPVFPRQPDGRGAAQGLLAHDHHTQRKEDLCLQRGRGEREKRKSRCAAELSKKQRVRIRQVSKAQTRSRSF